MLLKEVKNLCNTLTNQQRKCVQLLCFVGVYYWYLTYVLPLEAMQGTVTTTSVDESKHSCLPGEANSMCSSSTQPAGLGTVCSKVMITPVPAATGSSTRCGSRSRGTRLCFTDLLQECCAFRNSNKSSCDSGITG